MTLELIFEILYKYIFLNHSSILNLRKCHMLRPIHTAQTNANKLQQTSLLKFVGSVCYPCWRWLELVGVCFHPTEHAYRYRVGRCLLVQCEHDSYFSKDSKSNGQLEPTSLLEFVGICLCGVNWPLGNILVKKYSHIRASIFHKSFGMDKYQQPTQFRFDIWPDLPDRFGTS